MSLLRLHRAVLAVVPAVLAVLALIVVSAAHADTTVEGFGEVNALGLGATASSAYVTPTPIPEAARATAAAVGQTNSFVLSPLGVLAAGSGFFGLGSVLSAPAFTPIPDTAGAKAVATGPDATLILRGDGTVAGFGSDEHGQDGQAPGPGATRTPATVAGIDHVTAIAAGQGQAIALKSDGTVWSWGRAPYLGSAAATADTGTPGQVALPPGSVATAIAAGYGHGLALLQDGSVWGWGRNDEGEVGDGSTTGVGDPVQVIPAPTTGAPRVTAISAGAFSSFALYDDGSFVAWGDNGYGELGLGNQAVSVDVPTAPDPSLVSALPSHYPPLASISAVGTTTYAITRDGGRVYGWGDDSRAGLGFGTSPSVYDEPFPYPTVPVGADPGDYTTTATEIPQRVGRLKSVPWLGVGSNGWVQIAPTTPTLTPLFTGPTGFFSQPLGTVSGRQTVAIQSIGDPTTISSIKVTGPNAADFEVVRYNATGDPADVGALPLTVADGHALGVLLRFYPSALGERHATLEVKGDGETATVPLSGFGTDLPGNTPGDKGDSVTGAAGPAGPAGSAGAPGATGPAGKDGVVTFTTKKATTTVKRGRTATLSFTIKNATAGRLVATTATASAPKALTVKGGKAIAVRALAPGVGRTVSVKVTAGHHVKPGAATVKLRVPYGSRAVTATAKVKIIR
jgi:alpha-tubulin suppressor-like RCC1 family protein